MQTETRPYLLLMLAFGLLPAISGCSTTGGPEWKWERCYEGPPRAFADSAVLLVARYPAPLFHDVHLRVRSIDGERVSDATEYHLLPGSHAVVSQLKFPRNFRIEYRDNACALASEPTGECTTGDATSALTLEPGIVYRLTADLAWQKDGTSRVYWKGRGGEWCPRVEALGSFEALKDALARQQERLRMWRQEKRGPSEPGDIPWPYVALHPGAKPPKHWVLSEDDK